MPGRLRLLVALAAVVALLASGTPAGAVGSGNGGDGGVGTLIVRGPDEVLLPVVGRFAGSTVVSSTCGREVVYEDGTPVDLGDDGAVDVVDDDIEVAVVVVVSARRTAADQG